MLRVTPRLWSVCVKYTQQFLLWLRVKISFSEKWQMRPCFRQNYAIGFFFYPRFKSLCLYKEWGAFYSCFFFYSCVPFHFLLISDFATWCSHITSFFFRRYNVKHSHWQIIVVVFLQGLKCNNKKVHVWPHGVNKGTVFVYTRLHCHCERFFIMSKSPNTAKKPLFPTNKSIRALSPHTTQCPSHSINTCPHEPLFISVFPALHSYIHPSRSWRLAEL